MMGMPAILPVVLYPNVLNRRGIPAGRRVGLLGGGCSFAFAIPANSAGFPQIDRLKANSQTTKEKHQ